MKTLSVRGYRKQYRDSRCKEKTDDGMLCSWEQAPRINYEWLFHGSDLIFSMNDKTRSIFRKHEERGASVRVVSFPVVENSRGGVGVT